MPLTRYQIRNEYGLADPELYRAADRDDPEALLEGVAMAGLVGVLRQLGDLAEFAAEIFHDLHEEVMATATRGHGLVIRVQQLEADFPSIEKALLSQTHHSTFYSNPGVDWHPNLRSEQNLITRGDLPRFVMDSYEECRGPPRLFLLDKFDKAGAGACLKRYTDPSYFKVESTSSLATVEMQREKRIRKVKQKKGSRWRNGETPEVALTSHAKLHELFLEERVESGYNDPARRVQLKKRHLNGSAVDPKTGESYMKFMETLSPEHKLVSETSITPPLLRLTSDNTSEPELRIVDISTVSPVELSPERESSSSLPDVQKAIGKPSVDDFTGGVFDGEMANGSEPNSDSETYEIHSNNHEVVVQKQLAGQGEHKTGSLERSSSDGMTSEVDTYVDALATMNSETDSEHKTKDNLHANAEKYKIDLDANGEDHLEFQTRFSDTLSSGNSSTLDGRNNFFEKDRASLSHSDTLSDLVGDTPSDCNGAAEEFPSTETYGAQYFEMPSNKHSLMVEPLEATSKVNVVSHNTCIEEDIIPYSDDTSRSVFSKDTSPTLQHSVLATSSLVVSLAGSVLDETPSDECEAGHKSFDMDKNVYTSMSLMPDDSSQTKDEFTDTSASHPGDGLDVKHLILSSDGFRHLSNVEELASEDQSGITAMNEMLQTHCGDENSSESFTRRKIESPGVSISTTEEQLLPSAPPEEPASPGNTLLPNYRNVSNSDEMASKLDVPVTPSAVNSAFIPIVVDAAWSHSSEELVDAPQTHGLIEQQDAPQTPRLIELQDAPEEPRLIEHQFSYLNEDVPQLESSSSDTDLPHSREKCNVEEKSRTMEDEEVQVCTRNVDEEVGDTVSLELPSSCPTYPGHEGHVYLDDIVPNVETIDVPSAAVAQPDNDVNDVSHSYPNAISSPSRNFMNLHGFLPGFKDSLEKGSELDEVASSQSVRGSERQKEVSEEEVSPDSESHSRKSSTFNHSTSEVSNDGHNFSLDEQSENSMAVLDVTSESYPSKSTTEDHYNPNLSDDGHNFSPDEQTENSSVVHDVTTSASLEMSHLESDSESVQNHGEDIVSSPPTCHLPEPETSSGKSLELEANQVEMECLPRNGTKDQPEVALEQSLVFRPHQIDVECPQEGQVSINSSSLQSAHLGSPNHMDKEISRELPTTEHINQEICFLAPSDSSPENLPSQPSRSDFLPESASQELDATKQTEQSLESTLPSLVLPEATAVNLDDMPPLPPLPPMQWRMGNQNPSTIASMGDLGGSSQGSFLSIQQFEVDEKVQFDMPDPHRIDMPAPQRFDIPVPQRDVWQPQNPLLPLISVEDEKLQHVSEPSVGNMVQPVPNSLQLPTVVNNANCEYNSLNLGRAKSPDPFLSISEVSDDRFGHNHFALEGEQVQFSSNPFTVPDTECETSRQDPVSSHEAVIQPLQQLQPETGLEPKVLQQSFENSEQEQGIPLASVSDGQPPNTFPTSEGETAQSQPQTGLETKVLQQSFKNSELEQGNPLVSVTVLTMVDDQPQNCFSTSEGETAESQRETGLETKVFQQSFKNSEQEQGKPLASVTVPTMVDGQPHNGFPASEGETAQSSNISDVMTNYEVGKSNGLPVSKLPRPRNPLIDAVTAHGQSKLRKVTERVRPEVGPKVDERDSWLQQIRTKSFNLKPAPVTRLSTVTRPSIQGPATNLRVAAILERANAIRQATAGSDEDDDDSWSDS